MFAGYMMHQHKKWRFFLLLVGCVLVLDQGTKLYIHHTFMLHESRPVVADFFHLTYVRNSGAAFGLLAAACQALGAVMSRKAFAVASASGDDIDGVTAAYQRILGGVALSAVFLLIVKHRHIPRALGWAAVEEAVPMRNRREGWRQAWGWLLANGLAGPALGVSCYQWALKTTPTGIVLPIVAITPLVIIPFSYHLEGERPTLRSLIGGGLAVAGAVILAWLGGQPR